MNLRYSEKEQSEKEGTLLVAGRGTRKPRNHTIGMRGLTCPQKGERAWKTNSVEAGGGVGTPRKQKWQGLSPCKSQDQYKRKKSNNAEWVKKRGEKNGFQRSMEGRHNHKRVTVQRGKGGTEQGVRARPRC